MAIKKSELYSSLWASCDELRGGMDPSQYKDYVLTMLFVKYISDKYAGDKYAPILIPEGASFKDMTALVGKDTIGDDINKKILNPLKEANQLQDFPDFNDPTKLGSGKDMVDTLGNLILIFNKPELDFSKNKAEGDDILGDAYEYLMRHFATESGKSKGQFYTPSEVSRILAKIIGINNTNSTAETTAYDPTCGSGSLLLKVADEAEKTISLYGQEKENTTAGLARMNMILHNNPTANISGGSSTLSRPEWEVDSKLKTFDYCVANPPFSLKSWSNGVDTLTDKYKRFQEYGTPPDKNGDYAFLLHIIKSLKSNGKGAVILPHGVLFRGNAEAEIRKNIIQKGYIKGIIGLPANLFYGTGIPACIIVIDKENAHTRKGIFMIDAGKGFIKDGNKNRLRDQDIHKIVDVFNKQLEVLKFSRMVLLDEIADSKNDFNLNIPRYIDSQESEDLQDIKAHLLGGIPNKDIDALSNYWKVYPNLRTTLFEPHSEDYSKLTIDAPKVKQAIFSHREFTAFKEAMNSVFTTWKKTTSQTLQDLTEGCKPKAIIHAISETLLDAYSNKALIDGYDVYQHLMSYWSETMQDDLYVIATDGWKAGNEVNRLYKESKNSKKETVRKDIEGLEGIEGKLLPPVLLIQHYFDAEQKAVEGLQLLKETTLATKAELEEEQCAEGGLFAELDKINKVEITKLLKEKKAEKAPKEELEICSNYLKLLEQDSKLNAELKLVLKDLETKVVAQYPKLTETEIKTLVIEHKWMYTLNRAITTEMDRVSQALTQRIKELADRYATPLPELLTEVQTLEDKVSQHLLKMGFVWN
ncbi:type I restriction-modification system subunit M [Flavobacterium oncorhynchi]|uniref:type I restriction-modification system subunit M n=1 Tax=Flavobacterium oncorhynchi TaxID=728056 RepID=UPI00351A28B4